ncbi:uncharacterized protein EAF01_008902 [Botrytis porri]|uniref:Cysteine-rich transmembrane CYSTM domain-containing protein n=1 Tax=Botrytis porri TaxID=87229 RepID=A0A4Z1KH83_9HELO|nr:uncharacterized protein EAF01_008902 [Botrytis porri]KAF7897936.1 hypothetical protein EAF01_008902 [Botrytis porri]TGO83602.1 hypothetical protein BPOR_0621g00040 [Botrytis porri]
MSNPRPSSSTQSPAENQQIYDYHSQSKMAQQAQQPQKSLWDREPADVANMPPAYTQEYEYKAPAQPQQPQKSLWDRKPADVANMPPVYTQEYEYKAPAQPQPTYLMTDGKGGPREVVYVQQQKVEKKHNEDDVALGCAAGCSCCGCSVM